MDAWYALGDQSFHSTPTSIFLPSYFTKMSFQTKRNTPFRSTNHSQCMWSYKDLCWCEVLRMRSRSGRGSTYVLHGLSRLLQATLMTPLHHRISSRHQSIKYHHCTPSFILIISYTEYTLFSPLNPTSNSLLSQSPSPGLQTITMLADNR